MGVPGSTTTTNVVVLLVITAEAAKGREKREAKRCCRYICFFKLDRCVAGGCYWKYRCIIYDCGPKTCELMEHGRSGNGIEQERSDNGGDYY